MLRNHLLVALRVLRKSPLYSSINILGLALGLASCILMLFYAHQEWTYDAFHQNADRIYRMYRVEHRVRTPLKQSEGTMAPLGPALSEGVPGVEAAARFTVGNLEVLHENGSRAVLRVGYADPSFLDMFDFGGTPGDLAQPGVLLLTESAADRIGGNPAFVRIPDGASERTAPISGMIPDPPVRSSIQFDALAPFADRPGAANSDGNWDSFGNGTFVMLSSPEMLVSLESAIASMVETHYGPTIRQMIDQGWWADREDTFTIKAQPLREAHLSPEIDAFYLQVSSPAYSLILLGIAGIVLLIACTNFMALSIGRSVARAREVGTRKAMGASRGQVAAQFWGEAIVLSMIAVGVGLVLADLALPVFNALANAELTLDLDTPQVLLICGLGLMVGLGAGAYPAAILSGLEPARVLGGGDSGRRGSLFIRSIIVFQFAAAIALIASTLIMFRQMQYVADQDLGFASDEIIVVPLQTGQGEDPLGRYERLEALVQARPSILSISPSSSAFAGSWSRTVLVEGDASHIAYTNYIGPSFLETMGMDLLAGRSLGQSPEDSERAILINEALAAALGWDNPVGESLERWPDVQVVGVVRNFNHLSLHQEVQPMILHMSPGISTPRYAMVRYRGGRVRDALSDLETAWKSVDPGTPFQVEFLDERLAQLYETEQRWMRIAGYGAFFAVLISCLGLFGVATMTVAERRKEIGVRKVFGATPMSLASLVARDFALLILLAFVIGAPIALVFSERWLDSFAYQWPVNPLVVLAAGVLALVVALLTVGFQAVSAARSNPIDTLRYE
ncbi:MAG: FtsX-like permease family protein [Rhodothermales bacterium]|nr:FtsX-like permease family protein [Rhodothermales bacterium]